MMRDTPIFIYPLTVMASTQDRSQPFSLQQADPESYRAETRKASIRIIAVFAISAMLLAGLLVAAFGESGGNNFKWNLTGVLLGVLLTSALVGGLFRKQEWMQASIYGWRLKRSLMSITNQMHHLKDQVAEENPQAMQLLRFYHLALQQMHQLDGNSVASSELVREMDQHAELMRNLGLELNQPTLNPEWLTQLKHTTRQGKP